MEEDSPMNDILPEHGATISAAASAPPSTVVPSGSSMSGTPSTTSPVAPSSSNSATTTTTSAPSTFMQRRSTKDRRMRLDKIGLYRVGRTLGHGNFAHVRAGYHEIANTKVAIKIVDTQSIDAENMAKINREIQILQRINHPYIVKLYEVIRTDRYWYIITEYVGGGELFEMLTEKGKQPEVEARRLFQQIVSAVAGCHGSGIVHRDIKAENLLLDKDNNAKLIDFGFSNFQKPNIMLATWCGSPPYAAPELLLGQEYDGTKSDVWSLGVILYILVTAGFPFPGDSVDKLKRAVLSDHLRIPFWVSVECADLIRKMLTVQPAKRYNITQVSQHRWFTQNISDSMRDLIKTSLNNERKASPSPLVNLTVDRRLSTKALDPAVMIFMQQHSNWSEEQIVEDVLKQNYEGPIYATYELLNNKLAEFKDSNIQIDGDEQPRRGSRGSIISGKANVEPETAPTTIPAHHLAKLSLSTSQDYDSDDSSASDLTANEDSTSPRYRVGGAYSRRRMRRTLYQNIPEQQPSEQRRHTLCAADRLPINPLISNPQVALDSAALANAAAIAMANFARIQQLQRQHQQIVQQQQNRLASNLTGATLPLGSIPVSQERRASANEALLGLNSYAHLLAAACSTMGVPNASPTTSDGSPGPSSSQPPTHPTVEEEGQRYLSHYGLSKRNTLHAVAGMSSLNGLPSGSQQTRHSRTPYAKQNGNERRSSWASPSSNPPGHLSQQQQAQLEKIYRQSIGAAPANNDALTGIQQLQREFQKLKACTQEPSQPPPPRTHRAYSILPTTLLEINPPTIKINDEYNFSVSNPYEQMSLMGQSTQTPRAQTLTGQPRPATVIGLASTSSTASTPEGQPSTSMTMEAAGKSSGAVKYFFIPVSLETALERLPKAAEASEKLYFEVAPDTDLTKNTAHVRFSHPNGVLFEMILHRMNQSPNISRTEFNLLNGDQVEYDKLRKQLLDVFNEIC